MARRYEKTTAVLEHAGDIALNLSEFAKPLIEALEARGNSFDVVGMAHDHELQFISAALIITVTCHPDRPSQIEINGETPIGAAQSTGIKPSKLRFSAVTGVVLRVLETMTAQQVTWTHKGRTYVVSPDDRTIVHERPVRKALHPPVNAAMSPSAYQMSPEAMPVEDIGDARYFEEKRQQLRALIDAEGGAGAARLSKKRSTLETITLYAINTTVMVLSLPIGAGLMTYNLLRGGSIAGTSRILALTGTAAGLTTLTATQGMAENSEFVALLPFALKLGYLF
ncbi:hypothetical protein [Oceaniglobus indicus]|uniref:hypothetical protein n=1 Tax=Oceaniglobus indicus TaxID=2047749 RepID=UPI000C17AB5E|nr:hypothetical protein [Oceaniglobus indicus]